jgi:hypothetical protein
MNRLFPIAHRQQLTFSIITGVKCTGSKDALFYDGVLYCTPRLGGKNGTPRYSPISFTDYDGVLRLGIIVGCTVVSSIDPDLPPTNLFHISALEIATDRKVPSNWFFKRFQYSLPLQFVTINATQMVDHLFLYPDFIAPGSSLEASSMGAHERFWLVDREFTDRFGVDECKLFFDLTCGLTVEAARAYICKKAARGINIDIKGVPDHSTAHGAHKQFD